MRVIIRRFLELLFPTMILSVMVTFLHVNTYIPESRTVLGIVMLFSAILIYIYTIYCLGECFDDMFQTIDYFFFNLVAFAMFVGVVWLAFRFMNNTLFTWLFAVAKTFVFVAEGVSAASSLTYFCGIFLVLIIVIPIIKIRRSLF
ncbi:MAG: hypothetical protein IJW15_00395 [Clostridia bacterium]|nr:hypothetical protein [Clostridia bacterium]